MRKQFKAIIERDGEWYIGHTPDVPGANGQGKTFEECRDDLAKAIQLLLNDQDENEKGEETE